MENSTDILTFGNLDAKRKQSLHVPQPNTNQSKDYADRNPYSGLNFVACKTGKTQNKKQSCNRWENIFYYHTNSA
jgi:hypothetical protein